MIHYFILSPEIFLIIGIVSILLFGSIYSLSERDSFPNLYKNCGYLSVITLLGTLLLYMNSFFSLADFESYRFLISKSVSSILISVLILVLSTIVVISSYKYNKRMNLLYFEYFIFILTCVLSMLLMIHCTNFFLLYLLIELQSILLYLLVSFNKRSVRSLEAGLKYFILGSFSSMLLLFGISVLYGVTCLSSFNDLSIFFINCFDGFILNDYMIIGIELSVSCIILGILFKLYCAPFHYWISDIYFGAPTSTLIFIACVVPLSIVYLFLKLYVNLFSEFHFFLKPILVCFSVFSLFFGTMGALVQTKIKKLIAYSSITNIGFFLSGTIVDNTLLLSKSLMFFIFYTFSLFGFFLIFMDLYDRHKPIENIYELTGLYKKNSLLSILLGIFLFSLAGIPPFFGFFGKFYLFYALFNESYYLFVFFLLLMSMVSCFYYLKVIKLIYYDLKIYTNVHYNLSDFSVIIVIFIFLFQLFYFLDYGYIDNLSFLIAMDLCL